MSRAPASLWQAVLRDGQGAPVCLGGVGVAEAAAWAEHAGTEAVTACLGASQVAELEQLPVEKKRRERLAGRIAARAALAALLPRPWEELPMVEAEREGPRAGAPVVVGARACLSISHAGDQALAAAAGEALGVDVDRVASRGPGFEELALTPQERAGLGPLARQWGWPPEVALTLAWCAKEAALKWLGVGLRAGLQEVEVLFAEEPPSPVHLEGLGAARCPWVGRTRASRILLRCEGPAAQAVQAPQQQWLRLSAGWERDYVYALVSP